MTLPLNLNLIGAASGPLVVTPGANLGVLLQDLRSVGFTGDPVEIAQHLNLLEGALRRAGGGDLAARVNEVAGQLRRGELDRPTWQQSRLASVLSSMGDSLATGGDLGDLLEGGEEADIVIRHGAGPRQMSREQIGPSTVFDWRSYGNDVYLPPELEETDIAAMKSAGLRFAFGLRYVASQSGHGETERELCRFFCLSPDRFQKIKKGEFPPASLASYCGEQKRGTKAKIFPTDQMGVILYQAGQIAEPYQRMLKDLLVDLIFESQGWNLGEPSTEAPWDLHLIYGARLFVANLLLTREGYAILFDLRNRALLKIVRRKVNLDSADWHRGEIRREKLEGWFRIMAGGDPAKLEKYRKLGKKMLRDAGWTAPRSGSAWQYWFQWYLRQWAMLYHYGCFPGIGLPVSVEALKEIVNADDPRHKINRAKALAILNMIDGFFGEDTQNMLRGMVPHA